MADVYKIGVEIALAGTIIQGLEAIAAKLGNIHTKVKDVEGGFARWATAITGAASILASGVIVKGIVATVEAGGELVKQQALLANMGVSQRGVWETTSKAQVASQKVLGTTIAENIKGIRELMGVMPSLKDAQDAYVPVMQTAKVLESLTGRKADDALQTLAKAIELRGGGTNLATGKLDPERFELEARAAQAAIIASGGLINDRSLYQYMQTAGPSARMMTDPNKFYESALTAMMDMGGFRAGTAMTAVQRQLLGGKMTKPTAEEMERIGLLVPGKWHKSGTGVFVEPGGIRGEDILKDPSKGGAMEWANKILIPALAAAGKTSVADIQQEMYRVFGTETGRRMMGLYVQNQGQIQRDIDLYWRALGVNPMVKGPGGLVSEAASAAQGAAGGDAYENVAKHDLQMNVDNLHKSVTNFLEAFGAPMVPIAIDALQKISGAINSIAGMAVANPETAKNIAEGLVGLAAGLAVFGGGAVVAAMVAFAPGGVAVAAIAGLATAFGLFAAMKWGSLDGLISFLRSFASLEFDKLLQVGHAFNAVWESFLKSLPSESDITHALVGVSTALSNAIASIPGQVAGAISSMASGLANKIGAALQGLFSGGGGKINPDSYGPNFVPGKYEGVPAAPKAKPVVAMVGHVYMDGQKVGSVMWRDALASAGHSTHAPGFDVHGGYVGPDYATANV